MYVYTHTSQFWVLLKKFSLFCFLPSTSSWRCVQSPFFLGTEWVVVVRLMGLWEPALSMRLLALSLSFLSLCKCEPCPHPAFCNPVCFLVGPTWHSADIHPDLTAGHRMVRIRDASTPATWLLARAMPRGAVESQPHRCSCSGANVSPGMQLSPPNVGALASPGFSHSLRSLI